MAERYWYAHPRPAITVDVVVLDDADHVLLVRRGADPFQGRWALPGGFLGIEERLADAAARELEEETGLAGVTLRQVRVFDDPKRDPRGRTLSVAFLATVRGRPDLRAGSDAAQAAWFPLDRLPPLAFDHEAIVAAAVRAANTQGGVAGAH